MEKVLAVPAADMLRLAPVGLQRVDETQMLDFVAQAGRYYDRTPQLENDTSLKQIIPYIIVCCGDQVLMYQRTPKQSDARLHAKYSIGFGGHINPIDSTDGQNPVLAGRTRELNEELGLPQAPQFSFLGVLNIDHTPITQVHTGFVYMAHVSSPDYTLNEPDRFAQDAWVTPEQLAGYYSQMEDWSQAMVRQLWPALMRPINQRLDGNR